MDRTMAVQEERPAGGDPTRELVTAGGGDRCTNCQAPLASDQRYCVNCGERRGKGRVTFAEVSSQAPAPPASVPPHHQPRSLSSINFIAGVATLLLAMGVGVLIGQGINKNKVIPAAAPTQQVIKVVGGGGGGSGGGGGAAATRHRSRRHVSNTPVLKLSKKVTNAVNNAATGVLGSGANNLAPATVQPGQTCKAGQAGCQGGKFTGNFFGQ